MKSTIILALAAVTLVGCQSDLDEPMPAGTPSAATNRPVQLPDAEAGVKVAQSTDLQLYAGLVKGRNFGGARGDAFALRPKEIAYDASQLAERLTSEAGWPAFSAPPKKEVVPEPEEPQPYRRLAGVIIGDTVSAIIIMEGGRAEQIRPGMRIPNSEWTVVSIDKDKAVLSRPGNRKPNKIIVNLESAPSIGGGGGGNPGGGAGRGNAGGGEGGGRGGRGGRGGAPADGDK